ncbi:DNA cytosine methyltransferase, partial [Escherichia coli]
MKELCYGSVCSGIEAASIAWEPLGMRPVWFAEIESFPSAVLAHRWPHVANLGDMTKLAKKVLAGEIESPDVLVGGTPCQAFSIAGLRGGLDDERGALTLKYVELANAIDDKRAESFLKPAVIVWENVPGVLSSADNAFGCFLAGLAGEDVPFEPGDRPESGKSNAFWRWDGKTGCHVPKWPQCGCIYGPQRKVAWRILDAQYFGVAQRRRRVFVVASARTDLDPATVLFEFEGVRRNIAPSRGEGKETTRYTSDIAIRSCDDTNIVAMAHGQGGAEIKTDNSAPTLTCNHEAPIVLLGDGRMRRLTPVECERLQGFPDGHTLIPTEKRKKVSSDELAY